MDTRETLGQRLQRLRAQAGLTQAEVARAAQVPVGSLRGWEVDRREPGFRAACRLARVLGVTAEELADTVPVEEVGRAARPAGPTKRPSVGQPEARSLGEERPQEREPGDDRRRKSDPTATETGPADQEARPQSAAGSKRGRPKKKS